MSDDLGRAWPDALRMLARRDFCSAMLRQRLERKGHSEAEAAAACARCVELGYVNDRDYGFGRAKDLLLRKPSGQRALAYDLRRQGLPPTMIEEITAEVYAQAGGESAVVAEALRRWIARRGAPDDWRAVKRCVDHLTRRGFAVAAVQSALSPWLDKLAAP